MQTTLASMTKTLKLPDLKSCSRATITNGPEVPYSCCPSIPEDLDKVPYYKVPFHDQAPYPSPAHAVDEEYIAKYNLATSRMRELDKDPKDPRGFKQQANVHCAYCNGAYKIDGKELQVHESWLFFPFHRWYLYFYERILGSLIDDPTFALPYWNWDNPKGMRLPPMFDVPVLGSKLENGDTSFGENMGNFYSAGLDLVFYCHHGNVDRMWNEWKQIGGKRRDLTDKDWLNSEFFSTMKPQPMACESPRLFGQSYTSLPHVHANHNSSPEGISFELAITELLEDIGLEDEDTIAVTVVPKAGGETISIEGAEIKLVAC
ncbi:hypothetical protein K7X08_012804 [Anisodus acutangulus]|uniref:catechol oxidase n=1 Tax=Anisodus acutangulus TaxID=402998 RepID=A0A9Q1MEU2_9SOLA|nr:hypothetical protein K7X08_012804 [Anisodus acutangulus]